MSSTSWPFPSSDILSFSDNMLFSLKKYEKVVAFNLQKNSNPMCSGALMSFSPDRTLHNDEWYSLFRSNSRFRAPTSKEITDDRLLNPCQTRWILTPLHSRHKNNNSSSQSPRDWAWVHTIYAPNGAVCQGQTVIIISSCKYIYHSLHVILVELTVRRVAIDWLTMSTPTTTDLSLIYFLH